MVKSRTDRLFLLLQNKDNDLVRETAAQQLGEIARSEPSHRELLLNKSFNLLFDKQWETRTAAAQAFDEILRHTPVYFSNPIVKNHKPFLKCKDYDLISVITKGTKLKSKSYSNDKDLLTILQSEIIAAKTLRQRLIVLNDNFQLISLLIKERIGCLQDKDKDEIELLIKLKNVFETKQKEKDKNKKQREKKQSEDQCLCKDNQNGIVDKKKKNTTIKDSKERNNLTNEDFDILMRVRPSLHPKNDIDNGEKENESKKQNVSSHYSVDLWQWYWLLMVYLTHFEWEYRHGAAIGLRSLLKYFDSTMVGNGRVNKNVNNSNNNGNNHDCGDDDDDVIMEQGCLTCLSVLMLDEFVDFENDSIVAPIKETISQLICLFVKFINNRNGSLTHILDNLLTINKDRNNKNDSKNKPKNDSVVNNWEIRYSSFLGLKYLLPVHWNKFDFLDLNSMIIYICNNGLNDKSEDVINVASEVLLSVIYHIGIECNQISQIIKNSNIIVESLLNALKLIDIECGSAMYILSLLHGIITQIPQLLIEYIEDKDHNQNNNKLLNLKGLNTLHDILDILIQLLNHSSVITKQQAIRTLNHFVIFLSDLNLNAKINIIDDKKLVSLIDICFGKIIVEQYDGMMNQCEVMDNSNDEMQKDKQQLSLMQDLKQLWYWLCHKFTQMSSNKEEEMKSNNDSEYIVKLIVSLIEKCENYAVVTKFRFKNIKEQEKIMHIVNKMEQHQKQQKQQTTNANKQTNNQQKSTKRKRDLDDLTLDEPSSKKRRISSTRKKEYNNDSANKDTTSVSATSETESKKEGDDNKNSKYEEEYEYPKKIIFWNVLDQASKCLSVLLASKAVYGNSGVWLQIENFILSMLQPIDLQSKNDKINFGWKRMFGVWLLSDCMIIVNNNNNNNNEKRSDDYKWMHCIEQFLDEKQLNDGEMLKYDEFGYYKFKLRYHCKKMIETFKTSVLNVNTNNEQNKQIINQFRAKFKQNFIEIKKYMVFDIDHKAKQQRLQMKQRQQQQRDNRNSTQKNRKNKGNKNQAPPRRAGMSTTAGVRMIDLAKYCEMATTVFDQWNQNASLKEIANKIPDMKEQFLKLRDCRMEHQNYLIETIVHLQMLIGFQTLLLQSSCANLVVHSNLFFSNRFYSSTINNTSSNESNSDEQNNGDKIEIILESLLDSIKNDSHPTIQNRCCQAYAGLMAQCCQTKTKKNCGDNTVIDISQQLFDNLIGYCTQNPNIEPPMGVQLCIEHLCGILGSSIFDLMPFILTKIENILETVFSPDKTNNNSIERDKSNDNSSNGDMIAGVDLNNSDVSELLAALQIYSCLVGCISDENDYQLHQKHLLPLIPLILNGIWMDDNEIISNQCAFAVLEFVYSCPQLIMSQIIDHIVPKLSCINGDTTAKYRIGCVDLIWKVVSCIDVINDENAFTINYDYNLVSTTESIGPLQIIHKKSKLGTQSRRLVNARKNVNNKFQEMIDKIINSHVSQLNMTVKQKQKIVNNKEKILKEILPYVPLMIVPLLQCVTDSDQLIREKTNYILSICVRLIALEIKVSERENSTDDSDGKSSMPKRLKQEKLKNERILRQLIDPSCIETLKIPFSLNMTESKSESKEKKENDNNDNSNSNNNNNGKSINLRDYQQQGIDWLWFLHEFHFHGILADDMGLGKTLQTLIVIATSFYNYRNSKNAVSDANAPAPTMPPSLVICPATVVWHWKHEIEKFFGNDSNLLKPIVLSGTPKERIKLYQTLENHIKSMSDNADSKSNNHNHLIVITSYQTIANDLLFNQRNNKKATNNKLRLNVSQWLQSQNWHYCVLDEGHLIKNPQTRQSKAAKIVGNNAQYRLILSGTPIHNNVLDLWSLFDFLMPGYLGNQFVFNKEFSQPIQQSYMKKHKENKDEDRSSNNDGGHLLKARKNWYFIEKKGVLALERLHKQVLPFIMRRMKYDVLTELPPKIIQDFYVDLSNVQSKLYKKFEESTHFKTIKTMKNAQTFLANIESTMNANAKSDAESDTVVMGDTSRKSKEKTKEETKNTNDKKDSNNSFFGAVTYLRKLCVHPKLVLIKQHPMYSEIMKNFKDDASGLTLNSIEIAPKFEALREILNECEIGMNGDNDKNNNENGAESDAFSMFRFNGTGGGSNKSNDNNNDSDIDEIDINDKEFELGTDIDNSEEDSDIEINVKDKKRKINKDSNKDEKNGDHDSDTSNKDNDVDDNGHKVLIFTQLPSVLTLIDEWFFPQYMPNVNYRVLHGQMSSKRRYEIVQEFNANNDNNDNGIEVLALTVSVGGLGLNLSRANIVIFMEHDWNPMNDLQAMDRAHRIGQLKTVHVFRIITKNTIEEKIMNLQKFKQHIANTVISKDNSSIKSMAIDNVLDLFQMKNDHSSNVNSLNDNDDQDKLNDDVVSGAVDDLGRVGKAKKKSTKQLRTFLNQLTPLWTHSKQYSSEFDLKSFLKRM